MNQKRRILALTLTAALAVGGVPALAAETGETTLVPMVRAYDGRFSDVKNAWCADAVETCFEAKLMEGRQANRFDLSSRLTQAQIIVICARLHEMLTGGTPSPETSKTPWYQSAYDRLAELEGGAQALPAREQMEKAANQDCPRRMFSDLLLLVLKSAAVELPVLNSQEQAAPDLTPEQEAYSLYRWGILNGTDRYGTYSADAPLTRGQAVAILARVVDPAQRLRFTLTRFDQCRDVLGLAEDTVLLTIDGTSYTAQDCSEALCQGLRREQNRLLVDNRQELSRVLDDAEKAVKQAVAVEKLAQQLGITVTDDQVTAAYGPAYDGYRGVAASVTLQQNREALLRSKLLKHYEDKYGTELSGMSPGAPSKGESWLEDDLERLCQGMTVERSDAFRTLDLKGAAARMQKGIPAVIGSGYSADR